MSTRDRKSLNFDCPVCGQEAQLVINETQAVCGNDKTCNVLLFSPSMSDDERANWQLHATGVDLV